MSSIAVSPLPVHPAVLSVGIARPLGPTRADLDAAVEAAYRSAHIATRVFNEAKGREYRSLHQRSRILLRLERAMVEAQLRTLDAQIALSDALAGSGPEAEVAS